MYPSGGIVPAHPSIPAQIAEDWIEAQEALSAGTPKAAAVMFRRVLYGVFIRQELQIAPTE